MEKVRTMLLTVVVSAAVIAPSGVAYAATVQPGGTQDLYQCGTSCVTVPTGSAPVVSGISQGLPSSTGTQTLPSSSGNQTLPSSTGIQTLPSSSGPVQVVLPSSGAAGAVPLASGGSLPFTGADVARLIGLALVLLVLGVALVRRNRVLRVAPRP